MKSRFSVGKSSWVRIASAGILALSALGASAQDI
jgi:hypothetical protein